MRDRCLFDTGTTCSIFGIAFFSVAKSIFIAISELKGLKYCARFNLQFASHRSLTAAYWIIFLQSPMSRIFRKTCCSVWKKFWCSLLSAECLRIVRTLSLILFLNKSVKVEEIAGQRPSTSRPAVANFFSLWTSNTSCTTSPRLKWMRLSRRQCPPPPSSCSELSRLKKQFKMTVSVCYFFWEISGLTEVVPFFVPFSYSLPRCLFFSHEFWNFLFGP